MPPPKFNGRYLMLTGLGWTFMIVGVAGLFLPILQGVLFLAIGLIILSSVSPYARLWRQRLVRRYPAFGRVLVHANGWVKRFQRSSD
mgnify:FL=1